MKKISIIFTALILSISSFAKEIDGDAIPPMPDMKLNNSTLQGVDSDKDGVRDDVELWINANFPESADLRKAFKQMARVSQKSLIDSNNKEKSIKNAYSWENAYTCASYFSKTTEEAYYAFMRLAKEQKAIFLNTKRRILANIAYNDQLAGTSTSPRVLELEKSGSPMNQLCE